MSPVYPPAEPDIPKGLLIMGILRSDEAFESEARRELEERFGAIVADSGPHPFEWTDYYEPEMGSGLLRSYLAFDRLIVEDEIVAIKHETAALEARFAQTGQRRVNLDPGYLDYHKVVLASWKTGKHKIYLTRGVWADPVLIYETGAFHTQDWTFPDMRTKLSEAFFLEARRHFKKMMRQAGSQAAPAFAGESPEGRERK